MPAQSTSRDLAISLINNGYCSNTWRLLLRHTFEAHSALPGFCFTCQIDGCSQTFKNHSSILSHISRIHGGLANLEKSAIPSTALGTSSTQEVLPSCSEQDTNDFEDKTNELYEADDNIIGMGSVKQTERAAALFLLTMKEKYRVTHVGIDFTVEQLQTIISLIVNDFKTSILTNCDANTSIDPDFLNSIEIQNPFNRIQTQYM